MTTTTDLPTEIMKRCDASKLKVGDVYSRHSFGTITSIDRFRQLAELQNANGDKWTIGLGVVELEFTIAGQYDSDEEVSRTRLIELLTDNPRTAMTINFNKKPDPKLAAKVLADGKGSLSAKAWNAKVAEAMQGEERTMIGYHVNSYDEHRRLRFQESGKGQRLVDPRTLNWAIINRVRYTAK